MTLTEKNAVPESLEEKNQMPWKCGEPHIYPLPVSDGDLSWTTLLEPLLKKDKVRCEAWKEEVQNLLLFAGLFSAVVTAFVVESCKSLRSDPNDVAVILLSRVLIQLGSSLNGTASPSVSSFSPTSPNIRINVFWFLSLVFSLATVLIGIVSLQWLREYQRPRDDLPPRVSFSLYHMHAEGLERWYVPHIFTALPLLLQAGLVFFLVGLADFLWNLNNTVAVPVLVAVGLILFFLVMSTIMPTLQAFSLFLPRMSTSKNPRSQCPYKSPQSWAFHQLAMSLKIWVSDIFHKKAHVHIYQRLYAHFPRDMIFRNKTDDSWLEHGIGWLFQRDVDRLTAEQDIEPLIWRRFTIPPVPLYDAISALFKAKETASSRSKADVIESYDCFDQLSRFCTQPDVLAQGSQTTDTTTYNHYIQRLLKLPFPKFSLPEMTSVPAEILHEDNMLGFHAWRYPFFVVSRPVVLKQRAAEICVRLTEYMYANEPRRLLLPLKLEEKLPLEWIAEELVRTDGDIDSFPGVSEQIQRIIQCFFVSAACLSPTDDDFGSTTYTSEYLRRFLESAVAIASENSKIYHTPGNIPILQFLVSTFSDILDTPDSQRFAQHQYFFYCASIYARQLSRSDICDRSERLTELVWMLRTYKERTEDMEDSDLRQCLEIPDFSNDWWAFLSVAAWEEISDGKNPSTNSFSHIEVLVERAPSPRREARREIDSQVDN